MKVSISLPEKDIQFIDRQMAGLGESSRSAVVRKALELLREDELEREYAQRWAEWDEEEEQVWDVTLADGLDDEPDGAW